METSRIHDRSVVNNTLYGYHRATFQPAVLANNYRQYKRVCSSQQVLARTLSAGEVLNPVWSEILYRLTLLGANVNSVQADAHVGTRAEFQQLYKVACN